MKLLLKSLFILLIVFSCKEQKNNSQNKEAPSSKIQAIMKYDSARLRKSPDTNSAVIIILKKGEFVDILQKTDQKSKLTDYPEDYWYEVNTKDNQKGWVFGALMEIVINSVSKDKISENKEKNPPVKKDYNWKINNENKINTKLFISGNLLIFGRIDNNLYAIDNTTGKQKWKVAANGQINNIIIMNDESLLLSTQKNIFCISLKNGATKWQYKSTIDISSNIVFFSNSIFYADTDSKIVIIDPIKGKIISKITINIIATSINFLDNNIIIQDEKNNLYSIENPVKKEK